MKNEKALSWSGKVWRQRHEATDLHRQLAAEQGLNSFFAAIFADRALQDRHEVEAFLQPRLQRLPDPAQLRDMDKAVERLLRLIEDGEALAIFGDYDVDGVTSSALMVRYFRALSVAVQVYIPDRLTEGYGPNPAAMAQLAAEGVRVVITVDCGATAYEALATAQQLGLDVIVTDHHQMRDEPPLAWALINPNRPDESFAHKNMAGVGVAFYLLMALNRALRQKGWFQEGRQEPDLKRWLDLVAIGTIADVASLTGVNRILVTHGLRVAAETGHVGLRALQQVARLGTSLRAGQVAFQLGPRINAGGRLHRGMMGVELLVTDDEQKAQQLAEELEGYNRERQAIEERMLRRALALLEEAGEVDNRYGIVVAEQGWHPGVIGIVASRLAERLYRPVIVIALDAEGKGKGSGRSIPGIDLLAAIEDSASLLRTYGGHRAAAGLSLDVQNLAAFAQAFDQSIQARFQPGLFDPVAYYDGEVAFAEVTRQLAQRLERLQPFGQGNPEPVVLLQNVRVVEARLLKERHVKCLLADQEGNLLEAIAFSVWPGRVGEGLLAGASRVDLLGNCTLNVYREQEKVQLVVKDARPV
ncbi:single-stranded-DNA-specific exonuclease RecJ [Candidatus Magnetaquicoccus inordinatus]|uniref:single-stranded-DNA-specific exonuclease RecJ n=1 Tax=Candidatus Magnetaquicoccus inordinatus TaxID=2496818 RepID=UPI00102D1F7F|nr:single-stranded-DNA-specific exonuclease RecJ [Candidatus Magnetaquicoccus inordinatus]